MHVQKSDMETIIFIHGFIYVPPFLGIFYVWGQFVLSADMLLATFCIAV